MSVWSVSSSRTRSRSPSPSRTDGSASVEVVEAAAGADGRLARRLLTLEAEVIQLRQEWRLLDAAERKKAAEVRQLQAENVNLRFQLDAALHQLGCGPHPVHRNHVSSLSFLPRRLPRVVTGWMLLFSYRSPVM